METKHSQEYITIVNEIMSKWPDWKIELYNLSFAISVHAKKLGGARWID